MADMSNQSSAGPSAWDRELYQHLTNHADAEGEILEQYSRAAQQTASKAFRYLVNLLIEDEVRHHRLFVDLAKSLAADALTSSEEPIIPRLDFYRANRSEVLESTIKLLRNEQQDADELKRLKREMRDAEDTTMWSLLVDLMQRDTEKHIAILRFVQKHARKGRIHP